MKKSIWIYNDLAFGGGAEVVLQKVANYLCCRGYRVTLTTKDPRSEIQNAYSEKIRYYSRALREPRKKSRALRLMWRVLNYTYRKVIVPLRDHRKYDVRIAFKNGSCARKTSKLRAKEKYVWIHVDYSTFYWTKERQGQEETERRLLESFDKVICVSKAAGTAIKNTIGDPGNLTLAYNPIDYMAIRENAKAMIPIEKGDMPLFVSVGRISPEKQFDILLTACRNLQDKYRFQTWIIGDGYKYKYLKKRIEEENIFSVKLLGLQQNPFPYLAKADCYICCSKSECHPLAIQEATVLGVPTISTYYPSACEVVAPGMGIIVDNQEQALQNAMEQILRSPETLSNWKRNIEEGFSAESLWLPRLKRIVDIIETD